MKKSLLALTCLLSFQMAFAKVDPGQELKIEDIEFHEPLEKVKVKEVKELASRLSSQGTCLDEYLQRRKQLLIKFGLTPVTLTAAAATGFATGGLAGAGIAHATGSIHDGGWTALGYFVGGVMVGTATSVVLVAADSTLSGIQYYDNDLMMKALGEYYLDREGEKMQKLYHKSVKKMSSKPTYDQFVDRLVTLDQTGELCDGSLLKKPLVQIGFKLKYKLARPKHLKNAF